MRLVWLIALFVASSASLAGGQQATPSAPSLPANEHPARERVYYAGPGVAAPELLPVDPLPIDPQECKRKSDGKVTLSLIVDAEGFPRRVIFMRPLGTDFDRLAQFTVSRDRFKPGTYNGAPVAVAQSVEVDMSMCADIARDENGKKIERTRLGSAPAQVFDVLPEPPVGAVLTLGDGLSIDSRTSAPRVEKVGGGVTAPVVLNNVAAEFTDAARRAKYQGICLLTLIVDVHGLPQNVRVTRHLDYGLDDKAMEAVNRYRFKPAMKNGQPVPAMITIEVNFRLY